MVLGPWKYFINIGLFWTLQKTIKHLISFYLKLMQIIKCYNNNAYYTNVLLIYRENGRFTVIVQVVIKIAAHLESKLGKSIKYTDFKN